ncbi:MAG: alginate lyase family protein [Cohaesibacteraceae bacterium]|nr:alginate lyase family protein [Cohaesibacteraceae bacterium]
MLKYLAIFSIFFQIFSINSAQAVCMSNCKPKHPLVRAAKILYPGKIWPSLASRKIHFDLSPVLADRLCRNTIWEKAYSYDITKLKIMSSLKNPNDLRKSPYAEELINSLISATSNFLATENDDAAKFAIKLMLEFATADYPKLQQKKRWSHTISSGALFLFAAASAFQFLEDYEHFSVADHSKIAQWLESKILNSEIRRKRNRKWHSKNDAIRGNAIKKRRDGIVVTCCNSSRFESTRLQVDNALFAGAVLFNNKSALKDALNGYFEVLNTLRKDGSLPYQTARGNAAIWYQNLGVNVMVVMAEMAANQNINLYNARSAAGMTIHDAINYLAKSIANPAIIYPYARLNLNPWHRASGKKVDPLDYRKQFGPAKMARYQQSRSQASHFLAWTVPYYKRFSETPKAITLRKQLMKIGFDPSSPPSIAPLYNDYTGANMSCLFSPLD